MILTWNEQSKGRFENNIHYRFFGVHTIASSWVGSLAGQVSAQACSLYLFFYYLGSSISGTGGGFFYSAMGWAWVVLFVLMLTCGAFLAGARLALAGAAKIVEGRHLARPLSVFAIAREGLSTTETLWQIAGGKIQHYKIFYIGFSGIMLREQLIV